MRSHRLARFQAMLSVLAPLCALAPPLAGCRDDPDISSVEAILGQASPIAFAGTMAWAAVHGEESPCLEQGWTCGEPPCSVPVVATLGGADCPLGLGESPSGEVAITVVSFSEDAIGFAALFGDLTLDGQAPRIDEVGAATATRTGASLVVAWGDMDVAADNAGAEIAEGGWAVLVDDGGTPGEPADDAMEIEGARQWIAAGDDAANVVQTAIGFVGVEPSCRLNPTQGAAVVQALGARSDNPLVDYGTVAFHARCDGNVLFAGGGTGGFSGRTVPLDVSE